MTKSASVLFVCMGNICRSPAAEGLFAAFVEQHKNASGSIQIDSAGTHDYHVGALSDLRMREAALRRGLELTSRARKVTAGDLEKFDLVIAMDRENLSIIETLDNGDVESRYGKVCLFSNFLDDSWPHDVPDPYYGGDDGFEYVLDMILAGCPAILDSLRQPSATD